MKIFEKKSSPSKRSPASSPRKRRNAKAMKYVVQFPGMKRKDFENFMKNVGYLHEYGSRVIAVFKRARVPTVTFIVDEALYEPHFMNRIEESVINSFASNSIDDDKYLGNGKILSKTKIAFHEEDYMEMCKNDPNTRCWRNVDDREKWKLKLDL